MTRPSLLKNSIRLTSLAAGLLAAAAVMSASVVPPGRGALGAELLLNADSTGELAVKPAGAPFLRARELRAGGPAAEGALTLANQTSVRLRVAVRSRPADRSLDAALRVSVSVGRKQLFTGLMGELRRWSPRGVGVPAGGRVTLRFKAWVPRSARAWQNRMAESTLELRARPR